MTLLRGHFAMMLVCEGPVADAEIEQALGAAHRRRQPHRDRPRGTHRAHRAGDATS